MTIEDVAEAIERSEAGILYGRIELARNYLYFANSCRNVELAVMLQELIERWEAVPDPVGILNAEVVA